MNQRVLLVEKFKTVRPGSIEMLDLLCELGEVGSVEDIPLLIGLLESTNPDVRSAAAQTMARIGGSSAIQALLDALNQPDTATRIAVILALGQSRCPEVAPVLAELALSAGHMQIAEAASMALSLIGTPEALAASAQWMDRARRSGWYCAA